MPVTTAMSIDLDSGLSPCFAGKTDASEVGINPGQAVLITDGDSRLQAFCKWRVVS